MTYRKKLIEVALPLKAINEASAREKSIRHGHPSTLHLWWARRPLAACRAVLFASLVDDPDSDPAFRKVDGSLDEDRAGIKRADLFNLIEELVQWENSNNPDVIHSARCEIARCVASSAVESGKLAATTVLAPGWTVGDLVRKAHCRGIALGVNKERERMAFHFDTSHLPPPAAVNQFLAEHAPPVLDPFCGGGSIPLEAQRLGLRAYASDLNPVPVLVTKALIEIPPKFAGMPPVNPGARGQASGRREPPDEMPSRGRKKKGTQQSLAGRVWQGAQGLAEDVRYYGQWMRDEAEKRIGHLYPKVKITAEMAKDRPDLKDYVGQELTVIAWLWARTVASPNPAANGAHVPLVRSFWLSTKKGKEAYIQPAVDRRTNTYGLAVRTGLPPASFDPRKGTVVRTGATCLLTGSPISFDHIRTEGKEGRMATILIAIVAEGNRERVYLPAQHDHIEVAQSAAPRDFPETEMPSQALGFRVQLYGMDKHYKLFTSRQLLAMTTLSDLVRHAHERVLADARHSGLEDGRPLAEDGCGSLAHADAIVTYLAFGLNKSAEGSTTLCTWSPLPTKLHVVGTFGRQALPMIWDFAEANIFANSSGNYERMTSLIAEVIERLYVTPSSFGCSLQYDATATLAQEALPAIISTDPPYYDNIGYADLSDFAYIWLRRSLAKVYPKLFATLLTPKSQELIASAFRHDGVAERAKNFFEAGLKRVFNQLRQHSTSSVPLTVFYAFKQAEEDENDGAEGEPDASSITSTGWETMLEAVMGSGFVVDGTWPMRTERSGGFRNLNQNALASSIVLVCRPRPENAPLATRKEFLTALRRELPAALKSLQHGNIAPVDLAQAAIGPGMAVFTRYAKVMETDGSAMTVRTALGIINQVLDEVLAEQEGEFDADTRWALAWFEQYGMYEGPYGVAETLSKAKNTAVNGLVEAGVVKSRGGKVQLVGRGEGSGFGVQGSGGEVRGQRSEVRGQDWENWDPATDARLTVWEVTQHLMWTLETKGEPAAAALLAKLGGIAETARDLAYRLYNLCERKKWADEALAYNSLVIAWPELTKLAIADRSQPTSTQQTIGF